MKYERFEDLPVWKAGQELAEGVYALTRSNAFGGGGDLCDQLRRAALSISNNIAEGFERGSTAELLMFLYIARGSAGEVRSMLHFCNRLPECAGLKSEISNLRSLAESCARQLRGWADSLQNSDIRGPRHLNDLSRRTYESKRHADAFWKQLEDEHRRRVEEWTRAMNPPSDGAGADGGEGDGAGADDAATGEAPRTGDGSEGTAR